MQGPQPLENVTLKTLLALALCSASLSAQASLVRENGVLGEALTYQLTGNPGEFTLLMPSLNNGPTPLGIIDPTDPRSMDVGFELFNLWIFGALDGAGQAQITVPLSLDPSLVGIAIFAQFVTADGVGSLFDDISNYTAFRLSAPGTVTAAVEDHVEQIDGHTSTTLNDGRVLMAGGGTFAGTALDGFHLFDPQTGSFSATTGQMQSARAAHTATRLADGRVLLLGGADENGDVLATGDIWDPVTGLATPIPNMSAPRTQHSATLLNDGRVFVAGGLENFDLADPLAAIGSAMASTAIYDPGTNSWSGGPNMPLPRFGHGATILPSGRVLLTCGVEVPSLFGLPLPEISNDCRRYDPVANSILSAAAVNGARVYHGQTALPDGRIMLAGGADGSLITLVINTIATARVYDESGNSWTNVASLNSPRAYPNLVLAGTSVVAVGGLGNVDLETGEGAPEDTIDVSANSGSSWATPASLSLSRLLATASVIDAGKRVLVTGSGDNGSGGAAPDVTVDVFTP